MFPFAVTPVTKTWVTAPKINPIAFDPMPTRHHYRIDPPTRIAQGAPVERHGLQLADPMATKVGPETDHKNSNKSDASPN